MIARDAVADAVTVTWTGSATTRKAGLDEGRPAILHCHVLSL